MSEKVKDGNLRWFKHYNDARLHRKFTCLWAEKDHEQIAFIWAIFEMVSAYEIEKHSGKMTVPLSLFRSQLSMNRQRVIRNLDKIRVTFGVSSTLSSEKPSAPRNDVETVTVFIPNWLKYQETRGGKRVAKAEQKPGRGERREERGKNKYPVPEEPELFSDPPGNENPEPNISRPKYSEEFEARWEFYGRRGDKKAAFVQFQKLKLTPEGLNTLDSSIREYTVQTQDPKYRKAFERYLKTDWAAILEINASTAPRVYGSFEEMEAAREKKNAQ